MKGMRRKQCLLLIWLSVLFLFVSTAGAQNMQEIKSRMLDRKPTIDALKDKGIVGEGIDGYLHVRQQAADADKVVNAENADRRTVNGTIAKNEGTTVDQVSRKVAAKLIAVAAPGHWVQKNDGTWYRK